MLLEELYQKTEDSNIILLNKIIDIFYMFSFSLEIYALCYIIYAIRIYKEL